MRLFDPFSLSTTALANRAVVTLPVYVRGGIAHGAVDDALSAGLLLTELLSVDAAETTGGIADPAQASAWSTVVGHVQRGGGRIVARLTHKGPSDAIGADRDEIAQWIDSFAAASALALSAGFNGVEIHAADGFVIDRFLRSGGDPRGDAYGGSASARARLLLEVVEAVADVWGVGRVGVSVSPWSPGAGMVDSLETFTHAADALDQLGLAWLHLVEPWRRRPSLLTGLRRHFGGAIIASGDYTAQAAQEVIEAGLADCVAFEHLPADWPALHVPLSAKGENLAL